MKNRLKELRMENNLTLRELGKQLRMKNSTMEKDRRLFSCTYGISNGSY